MAPGSLVLIACDAVPAMSRSFQVYHDCQAPQHVLTDHHVADTKKWKAAK